MYGSGYPSVAQKFINGYTTFLNILAAGKALISFPPPILQEELELHFQRRVVEYVPLFLGKFLEGMFQKDAV